MFFSPVKILLAIFNHFWNSMIIRHIVFYAKIPLEIGKYSGVVQCVFVMINGMAIPCLSTALTDGLVILLPL